jgi:hypothetical protein
MGSFEDFKSEVDKFIHFLNDRLKSCHLDTDEEYDAVIDNLIIEYYKSGNRALVFDGMEYYEENLDKYNGKNPYDIIHRYTDKWKEPRDRCCPREHTCFIESLCGSYEAVITTISIMEMPYLYKKLLSSIGLFIPQFFIETISATGPHKYLYQINDVREYDPYK